MSEINLKINPRINEFQPETTSLKINQIKSIYSLSYLCESKNAWISMNSHFFS